jgi:2-polyprenyl-3-methyl-5-hydroxy-6-metoxy-1,4-benzoquinol methylase
VSASQETHLSCPICGAADPRLLYPLTDFSILACQRCRQIYLRPLPSPEEIREIFSRLYTAGEGSVPELKHYYEYCYEDAPDNPLVERYELWLDAIERQRPPGRLLDVGCGTGLFLSVAQRRGWEPFGIDDCAEATEHARHHFGIDVWVGEFADFPDAGRGFDAITGWDILEHARDPVGLLRAMHQRLAPGGVVALSTPNQRSILDLVAGTLYRLSGRRLSAPLEKFYIEQHFLYFTPKTLRQAFERAEFEVAELRRERTDLKRLTLSPLMRLMLHALFLAARAFGRENRLFAVARPTGKQE